MAILRKISHYLKYLIGLILQNPKLSEKLHLITFSEIIQLRRRKGFTRELRFKRHKVKKKNCQKF